MYFLRAKKFKFHPKRISFMIPYLPLIAFSTQHLKKVQGKPNASTTQLNCGRVYVAQLVGHSASMHRALDFISSPREAGLSNSHL